MGTKFSAVEKAFVAHPLKMTIESIKCLRYFDNICKYPFAFPCNGPRVQIISSGEIGCVQFILVAMCFSV